jgi:hypothetical protein
MPMGGHPRDPQIEAHIESISTRAALDTERLVSAMLGRCWPGGADRSVPAALEWVRLWGPRRMGPFTHACSCEVGHCQVCN